MPFYARQWDETAPGHRHWGRSRWLFEVDQNGEVLRQVEVYDGGQVLRYDRDHFEDDFGQSGQTGYARNHGADENANTVAGNTMHCRSERLPPAGGDVLLMQPGQRLAAAKDVQKRTDDASIRGQQQEPPFEHRRFRRQDAAQVVSVPRGSAEARAEQALRAFLGSLAAVFLALLVVVNLVLYLLVVRPVRRMAQIADRLSVGDASAPEFPTSGGAEIAGLGRSFNRMRKSLDKALRLLEP